MYGKFPLGTENTNTSAYKNTATKTGTYDDIYANTNTDTNTIQIQIQI